MSYRIDYSSSRKRLHISLLHIRLPAMTLLCFLIFVLLVNILWAEGTQYILDSVQLFREKTAVALNNFEEDFLNREPLAAAFSDLLHNICQ